MYNRPLNFSYPTSPVLLVNFLLYLLILTILTVQIIDEIWFVINRSGNISVRFVVAMTELLFGSLLCMQSVCRFVRCIVCECCEFIVLDNYCETTQFGCCQSLAVCIWSYIVCFYFYDFFAWCYSYLLTLWIFVLLSLPGLGFVTLGPFHCAYCMRVRWGGPDGIEA